MLSFQQLFEEKTQIDQTRNHIELSVAEVTLQFLGQFWLNHKINMSF